MWEAYKARRKFQYNGYVYAPGGPCECASEVGSSKVSSRLENVQNSYKPVSGLHDSNPCGNPSVCQGFTASGCKCNDSGYCGMNGNGKGACGILPYMYGGDTWIVRENDPNKIHILARRFAVWDHTLPSGDLLVETEEVFKYLSQGLPVPGLLLFDPNSVPLLGKVAA